MKKNVSIGRLVSVLISNANAGSNKKRENIAVNCMLFTGIRDGLAKYRNPRNPLHRPTRNPRTKY